MRRKARPKSRDMFGRSHSDELDLADAPDSDLADFGETATRGFSDAWDDADSSQTPENAEAIAEFGSDPEDDKGRDLDKKSKKGVLLLALVVLIGAGLGIAAQNGVFATQLDEAADGAEADVILALDAVRVYEAEPTSVELESSAASTDLFRAVAGEAPQPDDRATLKLPPSVGAGPLLWAGRMHVAVFGNGVGTGMEAGQLCAVVTLVTDQLAAIDVAGHGEACAPALAATGDRLSCLGDDLVLLEVWSDDPGVPGEPPPVASVRFRVEVTDAANAVLSRRGALSLQASSTPLLDAAAVLGGAPGDAITVSRADGSLAGSCTLIDRSDVVVKLLPS